MDDHHLSEITNFENKNFGFPPKFSIPWTPTRVKGY
jgi:hypothetical protein